MSKHFCSILNRNANASKTFKTRSFAEGSTVSIAGVINNLNGSFVITLCRAMMYFLESDLVVGHLEMFTRSFH